MKMRPEIKQKFLEALRGGQYRKCKSVLKNNDSFCASGVLCDLHAQDTGGKWVYDTYLNQAAVAPGIVHEWAGFGAEEYPTLVATVGRNTFPRGLESLNDNGLTFLQIADLIEQQW